MFRILIAGDDTDVVRANVRLLPSRYAVSTTPTLSLVNKLAGVHCDLLVLCHTIPLPKAAALIQAASERCPWLGIIWLAEWQTTAASQSDRKVICIDGIARPSWLEAVDRMADRLGYIATPPARRRAIMRVSS
jgi:hypothetical protein